MTNYSKITDNDLASGALYDKVNDMADALNAGKLEKTALGSRKASTSYVTGALVICEYHGDLLLKCTTAGTTASGSLDTSGALSAGTTISDGTVVWTAVPKGTVRSINGELPDDSGNITLNTGTAWSLLDRKWSDHIINDIRWLRADTFSWQSGSVYLEAYQHLVADIDGITPTTETVGSYTVTYYEAADKHKIVLPDQESVIQNIYAESGVAWYFILDTTNTRFKLPRINIEREELLQTLRSKGNGKTIGFTDGTTNVGLLNYGNDALISRTGAYDSDIGSNGKTGTYNTGKTLGLATDSTKSGIITSMTDSVSVYKGNQYLYFYVGEYTQTAIQQTAGLNAELFSSKQDVSDLVTSISSSSTHKQYPSAKCVYDLLGDVETLINAL